MGAQGLGGVGVSGSGISVRLNAAGSIAGGTGRGGQAAAPDYMGGNNVLVLDGSTSSAAALSGNIQLDGTGDTSLLITPIGTQTLGTGSIVSGSGSVEVGGTGGSGTLVVIASETFTGPVTIDAGYTAQLGNGTADGFINNVTSVTDNGALVFNNPDGALAGAISGSGSITQDGPGTVVLLGTNTYSGGTTLNAGTFELDQNDSAGTGDITFGAGPQTLQLDATGTLGNRLDTFGTDDTVDLHAIQGQGATLTMAMSGGETTLTVTGTGGTDTFTANTVANYSYVLRTAADGTATVVLQANPPPPPSGGGGGGTPTPTPAGPTTGDDNLVGTDSADSISLLAGNDRYSGLGGNDLIYGNQGNDLVYGNQGDDTLYGGMDQDTLYGGQGADMVYGNKGDDVVYGNQGDDRLFGGQGNDTAFGGQGNDVVYGNLGDDVAYGNLGNDKLYGGQGNDTLYGGMGDDVLFGNKGDDVLVGGVGSDTFAFNPGDTDFVSGVSTGDTIADFVTGTDKIDFTAGPAATAQNFGSGSIAGGSFAQLQAAAQTLINGGAAYAFETNGTDGFLFTTGGTGTTIADAVKLAGANTAASLAYTDIHAGAVA